MGLLEEAGVTWGSRGLPEGAEGCLRALRKPKGPGVPGGAGPWLVDLCGAVRSSKVVDGPGAPRSCGLLQKGKKQLIQC
jgi:hypothetical protein